MSLSGRLTKRTECTKYIVYVYIVLTKYAPSAGAFTSAVCPGLAPSGTAESER
jgi:hypothetical protein